MVLGSALSLPVPVNRGHAEQRKKRNVRIASHHGAVCSHKHPASGGEGV